MNFFLTKNFVGQNFFPAQYLIKPKISYGPKIFFRFKTFFMTKIFSDPIFFFYPKLFLGPILCLTKNLFLTHIWHFKPGLAQILSKLNTQELSLILFYLILFYFVLLKMLYFTWKAFKAKLFFTNMTPLTFPTTHPQDCRGGDTKRGEGGLIKVKKQVDFNIHFRLFKAFLDHVIFSLRVQARWVRILHGKFHYYYFFLNRSLFSFLIFLYLIVYNIILFFFILF